ncbi:MAG TPA: hypothetical protein VMV17_09210 [Streptosporangiaceae bacterium]|jgi:hypothetical protein|nr:hypothetical protein [Streptosporangiaceae bacterium]
MYAFAIMALLGLGVLAVMKIFSRYLSFASELQALVLVLLGIGGAWLVNVSLFTAWGIPVRASWIGITLTGLVIAGAAYFWGAILDFFGGLSRKAVDEAETIEKSQNLRRVA